jgi:outer membrane usher protein
MTAARLMCACILLLLVSGAAEARRRTLLLDVILNGEDTGVVVEASERDGGIYVKPSELRDAGLIVHATREDPVALSTLPGVTARVDGPKQLLVLTAEASAIQPHVVSTRRFAELPPITTPGWGALLNYDAVATGSTDGSQTTGGVLPEVRLFSPYGTLWGTAIASFGTLQPGQSRLLRLDTYYTYAEPEGPREWRAGDLITGGLGWSRPIRLGGGQVATDLDMRPDLIRYATPSFLGQATVPSTVDVLVNGSKQLTQSVPAGPFELPSVPVLTGSGDIVVAIHDALGRQTFISLPFYASTDLLAQGLTEYSLESGAIRLGYATPQSRYTGWTVEATAQHGFADWLTLSAHAEATQALGVGGGGAAVRVGGFGVLSLDVAASGGHGSLVTCEAEACASALPTRGSSAGGLVSVGFQHSTPYYDFGGGVTFASGAYRDVATTTGEPYPARQTRASAGVSFGGFGHLGAAWVTQSGTRNGFASAVGIVGSAGTLAGYGYDQPVSLLNLTYSLQLTGTVGVIATAYRDLRGAHSTGIFGGLTWVFGQRYAALAGATHDAGSTNGSVQLQRSADEPGQIGFAVQDQEGTTPRRDAEVEYYSTIGKATVAGEQGSNTSSWRVGAEGSVAVGGGSVFLANRIDDSFAIVRTGEIGNVPVLYENRPVGSTRDDGRLLVPYLRSYDANHLAIDPLSLPVDVEADATERVVRPVNGSGIVVDFGVRRSFGAIVRLQGANGKPIPRGAFARIGSGEEVPVGRAGRVYMTGLARQNEISVELPDGSKCHAHLAFKPVPGDIPVLGPVPCL